MFKITNMTYYPIPTAFQEGDMYNQPHSSSMASGSASRPPLSPSAAEGGPTSHSRHTSASSTNSSSSSNNRLSIAERNQAFLESLNRARDDKVQRS